MDCNYSATTMTKPKKTAIGKLHRPAKRDSKSKRAGEGFATTFQRVLDSVLREDEERL